jgi:MFS family permease
MSGSIIVLILVRFALGSGKATMYPATSQFVERWFPMRERGKRMVLSSAASASGLDLLRRLSQQLSCIMVGELFLV